MNRVLSPCGQAVEYLNRCYGTHFRLWVGGAERIVPARWYFCKPGAPRFPYPTVFSSHVFWRDFEDNPTGGGEVDRQAKTDNGSNTGFQGGCLLGKPEWFATGRIPADAPAAAPAQFPECCWKPEKVVVAGVVVAEYTPRATVGPPRPYAGDAAIAYTPAGELAPAFKWHSWGRVGYVVGGGFNLFPYVRGDAGLAYTARGRPFPKPRQLGRAELGYLASAELQWLPFFAGRAELGYLASAELQNLPFVAGRAELGYLASAELVGPHVYAGVAELGYLPRALVVEDLTIRGVAELGYLAPGLVGPVWTVAGQAVVGYAPAARGGPIFVYAGDAGLAYADAGRVTYLLLISGDAIMQLTPNATLTYLPATVPGASCAAAGRMTLGTTYGPFTIPAAGVTDWFVFTAVGGHTYTLTFPFTGAGGMSGVVAQGSCPSPTNQGGFGPPGASITPSFSGDTFLKLVRVGGTGTYTIKVA